MTTGHEPAGRPAAAHPAAAGGPAAPDAPAIPGMPAADILALAAATDAAGGPARPTPLAAAAPLTVTISIDGGAPETRHRVLTALRDLVAAAGADAVGVHGPVDTPPEPGIVRVDPAPRAAFRDGRLLDLSRLEYDLLLFLAEHPRQVFSRAQLLARVWGHVRAGARTVDVHVSRLRHKLGAPELIATVYGVGYRLADDAPVRVVRPGGTGVSWTA